MGGLIPIQHRFIGGGLFFLLGSQLIYYGMKFNGSARLKGPVWGFVSGLHDLIVYGFSAVAIAAVVLFVGIPLVFVMIPDGKPKKAESEEDVRPRPTALPPEEMERQRREYEQMMQETREHHEQEQKRIEDQRKIEEQKKQDVIKARRERSATDAAHAGLYDFL